MIAAVQIFDCSGCSIGLFSLCCSSSETKCNDHETGAVRFMRYATCYAFYNCAKSFYTL